MTWNLSWRRKIKPNYWMPLMAALFLIATAAACTPQTRDRWSQEEQVAMQALWIGNLKPLPADPSNQYADDPLAAALGQKLFFDTRFSFNGQVACATCHQPEHMFQDNIPFGIGVGTNHRRTMTIVGTAYSPWMFWDGRKDSQWAQALGPWENPVEHGGNRTFYAHLMDQNYRTEYEAIFGPMPEVSHLPANAGPVEDAETKAAWESLSAEDREAVTRIYANMGKAIAAYERLIMPGASRFDAYVEALSAGDAQQAEQILSADEAAGLRLFIGKANCTQCHNGPLLTNNDFHNTGVPAVASLPEDTGRALGAQQVMADEFNCLSDYSDASEQDCAELKFMTTDEHQQARQFKPPSLRGVVGRGPFMHAGQFATLEEVLSHYNSAPEAPAGHSELEPLNLSQDEIRQLIAFLGTLSGPIDTDPLWLAAPSSAKVPR